MRSEQLMRRPRSRSAGVTAIITLALALSACVAGPQAPPAPTAGGGLDGTPVDGGTITLSIVDPGSAVDPVTVSSPGGTSIVDTVAEKLVHVSGDYQAEPLLATSWQPSADGLSWTFTLRPGVTFNTGQPMTSADVVATFERLVAPDSASAGKGAFEGLLAGVSAPDDASVVFTLTKPFSDFPFLVSGSNTQILPADYEPGSWEKNPVGTGPFTVSSWNTGQSIVLTKNESYWNASEIHLAGLKMNIYRDQQARVLSFQSGAENALIGETIPFSLTSALDSNAYTVRTQAETGFSAFVLRTDQPPFDDVKVRQAVAAAIDRDAIINTVYGGGASLGNDTVYSPSDPVVPTGVEQREASADTVKSLLGDKKVSFTITTSSTDESQALLIQQQLKQYPNFDVEVKTMPADQYFAPGENSPWLTDPATITFWSSRPSPSQYINFLYRTGAVWNASHYSNPTLDTLADQYDAAVDPADRQAIVDQIGQIMNDDVPVIIAAFGNRREYLDPSVHMTTWAADVDYTGAWVDQ
ncbi:ABC transporter substrate-binding protein [Herbiconiux sp. CPCC 205763]|uniref:ABC transporter substrate-binding protein n=1 Tax=Herbiconiux aconitum TaxID=2970913 RepID=A0ABT2GNC3_9MICO|nr:ABC transporter substrate-binding protein [Herbiconiux aconitum]MCS5717727.1 ABC transporter substrate-binding protein [Herbiconiux aconitum]